MKTVIDFGQGEPLFAGEAGTCFKVEITPDNHAAVVHHLKKCGLDVYKASFENTGWLYMFNDGKVVYDMLGLGSIPALSTEFLLGHIVVRTTPTQISIVK